MKKFLRVLIFIFIGTTILAYPAFLSNAGPGAVLIFILPSSLSLILLPLVGLVGVWKSETRTESIIALTISTLWFILIVMNDGGFPGITGSFS